MKAEQLLLSDFDYDLPRELVAAYPPEDRPSARLLYIEKTAGAFSHQRFSDLAGFLKKGDVLVLNDTKVIPARIFGAKATGGKVEALLLKELENNRWQVLLRPGGRIREGALLSFGRNGAALQAKVSDAGRPDSGIRLLEFEPGLPVRKALEKIGHIPLPPYLDRPDSEIDRRMYQTVFARREGAVASPTAGLHFNEGLLEGLKKKGVEILFVTLHVSYATFQPVTAEDIGQHRMFSEDFEVSEETAGRLNRALREERRIVACGTTSVRALESAADGPGRIRAQKGETRLFIYPGYEFKITKGLITNFHLPKSSLLLMVAAFLGHEKMRTAYEEAIRQKYRFYSYGDAMLII